jgi:hypothetical protein
MKTPQFLTAAAAALACLAFTQTARAQCTEVVSGLKSPSSTTWTNQGNLLISEDGDGTPHSGRISIVEPNGTRRTLLAGLPSGMSDVGEPSGPGGLAMRGRTLYVAISVGNVAIRVPGMPPRTALENPAGPSSPLFSSVLKIEFSAAVEKSTQGFTLTAADQQALAAGETITLGDGSRGGGMTVQMIANFPNFVPEPLPQVPGNIRVSNPFDLVAEGNSLYVTDGGMNHLWRVELNTGSYVVHAQFDNIPNPLFGMPPQPGPPFWLYPTIEAVPTGITSDGDQLLVSIFSGFPFAPGVSSIQQVDPVTGAVTPLITGRKNAIDVLPVKRRGDTSYLVLQFASAGIFFNSPGQVLHFDGPAAAPTLITDCLMRPVSMALHEKTNSLYITEGSGRLVKVPAQ